jgi:hypothetical protein
MMAVETDLRGEAPSGNNAFWFQGGPWFSVVTDGLPSLYDQQALIFPVGHSGKRSINQQPPIPGRKWSAGDANAIATAEYLGQWLFGAMGTASHTTTPGTDAVLMDASEIETDTQEFNLTTQPSDGGAIIQIALLGTGGSGSLQIRGTDSEGNSASEVLSWDAEAPSAVLYSRTSFSGVDSILMKSLQLADGGGASLAVNGIQYFTHEITAGPSNPTFSIERLGDPAAGAASKSFMHTGMVLQTLTMDTPAAARDGIITISSTWEGDPTATCDAKAIQEASGVRLWPAWILSVTRDGDAFINPTNNSLTINSGARNYRSAAGVQHPQGSFFGGREITQSFDMLLDNEIEFNRWRGASRANLVFTYTAPWKLTSSDNVKLTASMTNAYLENVSGGDDDGMFTYSADARNVADAENDVAKFIMIDNIPPEAYGGSTVID